MLLYQFCHLIENGSQVVVLYCYFIPYLVQDSKLVKIVSLIYFATRNHDELLRFTDINQNGVVAFQRSLL